MKVEKVVSMEVGDVVYIARHYSCLIRRVVITKGPFASNGIEGFIEGYTMGESVRRRSLGDMGYGKYAYDDRPQQIWGTYEDAVANHPISQAWWSKGR